MKPGYEIVDVFGFDAELLMMLPSPILGIIFLFPPKRDERPPKVYDAAKFEGADSPFFLWQTKALDNACGAIACIHAVANNLDAIPLSDDSTLQKYLKEATAEGVLPEKRGLILE